MLHYTVSGHTRSTSNTSQPNTGACKIHEHVFAFVLRFTLLWNVCFLFITIKYYVFPPKIMHCLLEARPQQFCQIPSMQKFRNISFIKCCIINSRDNDCPIITDHHNIYNTILSNDGMCVEGMYYRIFTAAGTTIVLLHQHWLHHQHKIIAILIIINIPCVICTIYW